MLSSAEHLVAADPGPAGPGGLAIEVAGERLHLLPERAAFWPRERWLLVADAHFGKAASFRAQGVPVPGGTTGESLRRLESLVARTRAAGVVFLGDFLHSRHGRTPGTLEALAGWRALHPGLVLRLVRGNHDVHAGDPPASLGVEVVQEPLPLAPWLLCHEPGARVGGYVIAGHIHPAVRISGRANESLRLPCFWFGHGSAVLPAFGAFTGSALVAPAPGDRVCVIAGDRVLELPPKPQRNRYSQPARST